jgi:hypothetical protein
MPNSLAALGSVIPSLIFEMTCPIESQVSWLLGDSEKYCLEVFGLLKGSVFFLRLRAMRLCPFRPFFLTCFLPFIGDPLASDCRPADFVILRRQMAAAIVEE